MRILVTGAAGYVGSVLTADLLSAGHEVTALDDLSSGSSSLALFSSHPAFSFMKADAGDEGALKAALSVVDAVMPLAAVVGMAACDKDPNRARQVNLDAIHLLMRLRSKNQRVVFPTTNSAYGTRVEVCTEETPIRPLSLYARLKAEAEKIVLDAENTVSLRLATVFGYSPRMRFDLLVNDFVWRLMRERELRIYEPAAMRNFISVHDVSSAFRFMIEWVGWSEVVGLFNLGNDAINTSKLDLAQRVASHLHVPFAAIRPADGSDADLRNYVVSSEKLSKVGFTAKISLDDGIRELIAAYRAMPMLYS